MAALGPGALAEPRGILEAPSTDRTETLRALTARPASADLATLIAMADTDEIVRVRPLRAIRDIGEIPVLSSRGCAASTSSPRDHRAAPAWLHLP